MRKRRNAVLKRMLRIGKGVAAAMLVMAAARTAQAVGTAAGTSIDNRAVINYSVSGVPQELIESSPTGNSTPGAGNGTDTSFLVDNMLDLTVAEVSGSYTAVVPAATSQVLAYTVTNTGNNTQDFSLSAAAQAGGAGPFGGTDNFDAAPISVFVDGNANGVYDAGVDTATFIDELAADATITVFVVGDIPAGLVDGDLSVHILTAQVAVGGGVGVQGADILADDAGIPDDPATIQTVFADGAGVTDGANDGRHSDDDGYVVASADLSISKSSTVISDPVNGAVNPKAIPLAIVEYTITIANDPGAGASATSISVSDDLSTEIGAGTIAFEPDSFGVGMGIEVTAPNIGGGAPTALTNAVDPDQGDFGGTGADTVTVTGIDLAPGESATVRYRVEVQ
jgi:hypothetical protein